MHESLLPTPYGDVRAYQGPLLERVFFGLSRCIGEGLGMFSLLQNSLPCFGLPGSRGLGTVAADVSELSTGVTFSIFLPYLGVVDLSAVIQVVIG